MNTRTLDLSLYFCTDREMTEKNGGNFLQNLTSAILGGVTCVQLREKKLSSREFFRIGQVVQPLTQKYGIPLIINDRADVALALNADGVHVGQEDLPCNVLRKVMGADKIIGVSVSNADEAVKAERDGATYLGVGAMMATATKKDAEVVTVEVLRDICQNVNIPVVAIGGININTISRLQGSGIDGVAVVSALAAVKDPQTAASEIKEKFGKNLANEGEKQREAKDSPNRCRQ